MKKILITGFEPFSGFKINPSQILLKDLQLINPKQIDTLLLPVRFANAFEPIRDAYINIKKYDFILMLGQAAGRNSVSLERIALNWQESKIKDEDGYFVNAEKISLNAPDAYINENPLTSWTDSLSSSGPVSVSFSAGTYVCNYIYFRVINEIMKNPNQTLFVHLPILPEQNDSEKKLPNLDYQIQLKILSQLVELILQQQ